MLSLNNTTLLSRQTQTQIGNAFYDVRDKAQTQLNLPYSRLLIIR